MGEQPAESRTSISLLQRLNGPGTPDQDAWREFVEYYGGKIYGWCLRGNLQEADARDVTQQVLLKLVNRMKGFTYDPSRSFRAWLCTVTRHALKEFQAERPRPALGVGGTVGEDPDWILGVEAREDLVKRLEEEFDRELLEEAIRRVRRRVATHTWDAFRLTALDGLPAAEVALRLQMKVVTVYKARSSVLQLLQETRKVLEEAINGPPEGAACVRNGGRS